MEGNSLKLLSKYRTPIMGFAAVWILIFHAWTVASEQYSAIWRVEYFIKKTGFAGVDIFFFVSGLGLVHAINKYNLKEFYFRRFINIYPAFFLTGVILIFTRKWDIITFLKNVTCVRFYTESIYQLLWFVPAILTVYLLFPLYYKIFRQSSNKLEFTICVWMIWLFLSMVLKDVIRGDFYGFTNRIPIFIAGIYLGDLMKVKEVFINKQRWILIIIGFLLGVYLSYFTNIKEQYFVVPTSNCCIPNFLMGICGSILLAKVFWFIENNFKKVGEIVLKIFTFLGIISFELYCAQEEVVLIHKKILLDNTIVLENIVTMIVILIWAILLHIICGFVKKLCLFSKKN
ncbi:MAG: acyltransferase [Lachnospiraceae bacterium]|nr:acyltransferase [Lachnospiraceae bacterium]